MKILSKSYLLIVLSATLILQTGAIRKNQDPIKDTQTEPIAYSDKQEALKDGEKGAPAPSFKFYEKENFLVRTPTQTSDEEVLQKDESQAENWTTEVGFQSEEDDWGEESEVSDVAESHENEEDWWIEEDSPT